MDCASPTRVRSTPASCCWCLHSAASLRLVATRMTALVRVRFVATFIAASAFVGLGLVPTFTGGMRLVSATITTFVGLRFVSAFIAAATGLRFVSTFTAALWLVTTLITGLRVGGSEPTH